MEIRIRSEHYRIQNGNAGLFLGAEPALTPFEEERSLPLGETLVLAQCLRANTFTAAVIVAGSYEVFFSGCTIRHLPSAQTGLFCNIVPLRLVVTEESIRAESVDLELASKPLLRIRLFKNGVPAPHARVLLAGEMVTLQTHTDDHGSLLLVEDLRDILAVDCDQGMVPEVLLYDDERTEVVRFLGPLRGR